MAVHLLWEKAEVAMARGGNYVMRDVAVNAPETSTHKRGLLRWLILLRSDYAKWGSF